MELYLLKQILDQSITSRKLYLFHTYGRDSKDYCGYVQSFSNDIIQIQHYTKYGERDGIIELPFDNIRTIAVDGDYIQSVQYLIDNQKDFQQMESSYDFRVPAGTEGPLSILNECVNNRNIILTLETDAESYIGFVDAIISTSYFVFTEIYNAASQFETAVHRVEDIKFICINDKNSRKNWFIYKWYKNRKSKEG